MLDSLTNIEAWFVQPSNQCWDLLCPLIIAWLGGGLSFSVSQEWTIKPKLMPGKKALGRDPP